MNVIDAIIALQAAALKVNVTLKSAIVSVKTNMIYVLYGQPGAGKTTLSKLLAEHLDTPHIIDGDELRELFVNNDFSREGRERNITRAHTIATFLSKTRDRPVILALVNPYEWLREDLRLHNKYVTTILLQTNRDIRKEYHVQDFEVGKPDIALNTDRNIHATYISLLSMIDKAPYYP